jgi:hypothetical protein
MKLVLSVTLLQRSVAVEIDRNWIADVKAPSRGPVEAQHPRTAPITRWSSPS